MDCEEVEDMSTRRETEGLKCEHPWIQTPWNPTFTDGGGLWKLYKCLQCGRDLSLAEMDREVEG